MGDSRAYLVRGNRLQQLTRDHTVVAELVAKGTQTSTEAAVHPMRSSITRAVGVQADVDVDLLTIDLNCGDQILLCSDGLVEPLTEQEILSVLTNSRAIHETANQLVQMANDYGGPDNVTVVLLRYNGRNVQPASNTTPVDFLETIEY